MIIKKMKFYGHQPFLSDFLDELNGELDYNVVLTEDGLTLEVCIFSDDDEHFLEYIKQHNFIQGE